jgi:hypothetical protein
MARNATARLLNVTCDTPSRGVAHRLRTRSMRQSPTPQRGRGNGVVRAWTVARHHDLTGPLASDTATPLAAVGGLILWLLRLSLAPISTLAGFRAWVLAECPTAPRRRAPRPPLTPAATPPVAPSPRLARVPRPTKTARFLTLVTERHGPLAAVPLDAVAGIAAALAPQAGLNPGAARTALRRAVLSAQNGDPR